MRPVLQQGRRGGKRAIGTRVSSDSGESRLHAAQRTHMRALECGGAEQCGRVAGGGSNGPKHGVALSEHALVGLQSGLRGRQRRSHECGSAPRSLVSSRAPGAHLRYGGSRDTELDAREGCNELEETRVLRGHHAQLHFDVRLAPRPVVASTVKQQLSSLCPNKSKHRPERAWSMSQRCAMRWSAQRGMLALLP